MRRLRIVLAVASSVAVLAGILAMSVAKDGRSLYVYERTGLSFRHDPEFSVYPISQEGADFLVLRKAPGSRGFYQVAVYPFDGPAEDVSLDLLRQRNPGAPMYEKGAVGLAVGEALAVEVGEAPWKTYEIWFAREGHIYQFLADSSLSSGLRDMAESARFDNAGPPR